jgi:hypothetical protein
MELLLGAIIAFLLFKSGALNGVLGGALSSSQLSAASALTGAPNTTPVTPPPAVKVAPSPVVASSIKTTGVEVSTGISTAATAATAVAKAAGAGSAALSAIPVVGAAFAAIASVLIAASQKRAQEAESENQAVAQGVPAWDQAVATIANAFNAGQITAAEAQQGFALTLSNYWSEVTPQIQPGRNGCNGGKSCPASANVNSDNATGTTAPSSYCSGNIGAACCVGCSDLALSVSNLNYAASIAEKTGKPATAFIQTVFASKYGGVNRPSYFITLQP